MLLIYALLSCQNEEVVCPDQTNPSLSLSFVDDQGLEVVPDSVEWYHNSAAMGEISQLSSTIEIGSNLAGEFEVIVTKDDDVQVLDYTVHSDICQVSTVVADVVFPRTECVESNLPSVIVSAQDQAGNRLIMDQVTYSIDGGALQNADCWNDCSEWVAGSQQSGVFQIFGQYTASSMDPIQEQATVLVEEDECNIITQEVSLFFNLQDDQDCADSIDDQWVNYFEQQFGCGDLNLYATMEGGFQLLFLQAPSILEQLELNVPLEFDLANSDIVLGLQFGYDLDQGTCSTSSANQSINQEFVANSGKVLFTLQTHSLQSVVISADVQDVTFTNSNCATHLVGYRWEAIVVED